ncbi:hypothetical protein [Floridanema evergladense]|uniref:Uncharacterized protein n=1 Tax=Floridaenema evergladense BLCC-F167 TaxID=3153639 RepID=A0ABV4WU09_9CYAN
MSEHLTEWQPVQSDGNISGFSDTEISIYQKVAEDNQNLQKQCQTLQSQLNFWLSVSNWCQAIFAMSVLIGVGVYFGYLFANIDAYQRGYRDAELKANKEICGNKYPQSVSAFKDCMESR